jgi:CheY-like chemotaxis protein/AraC-like DNA-binding protein
MPANYWEATPPPRILVIDDNPTVHEAFDEILRRGPTNTQLETDEAFLFGTPDAPPVAKPACQIEHALSGAEGVEKVRQTVAAGTPYQVAFVDIRMPGMDGVETIERVWALDASIQTVICTAYADYRWEDLARRLGQTDRLLVLKKPFHDIEVMQLASTLAQKWHLARQAVLKFEQAETLVAQRTQRLLEFRQREQQWIQEVDQAKVRHVLNLAQEFRGPLTTMLHTLENPARGGGLDRPAQESLQRSAQSLLQMLEDSLLLRQLDERDRQLEWQEADVATLVRGLVPMFAAGAQERRIKLEFAPPVAPRLIWTDVVKLEKALFNLFGGSLAAAANESVVSIHLHFDATNVHLSVNLRRLAQGAALVHKEDRGLWLSREILQLLGGRLSLDPSDPHQPGPGSLKIHASFPCQKPELAAGRLPEVSGAAHLDSDPTLEKDLPVILLIEENSEMRALIRQGLGDGYSVVMTAGAQPGLAEARENVPDLIVVGGTFSAGDEVRLCADFKHDELTSHIPVILLSPDVSDASQVRALKAGVDDLLGVPFRLPLLKARVDNLLENRRKLHEHFQQLQTVQPRELAMNQVDAEFLRRVVGIVEKNLADYEFDMETLARQLAVSRRQLFRKFKALAGCTPNVFIRDIRLKRAAQLLRDSPMTVSEIIYAVGFSDPKYFRNIFRERFGVLPGEYNEQTKRST